MAANGGSNFKINIKTENRNILKNMNPIFMKLHQNVQFSKYF